MNINYFTEFVVLAETKNYWEASERLFLNQSTLSKHIKAMEQELGIPLFNRTTRKVTLTEFGQTLLPYAQAITKIESEYTTALRQKQNQSQHAVMLGSISAIKQYHITDIISEFHAMYPAYTLHVIENDTPNLKKMLLTQKCELAFLRESKKVLEQLPAEKESLIKIPCISDYIVAVVPDSHQLCSHETLTLKDLAFEKFCFPKKNTILYRLCYSACLEAGFEPNIVYESHYLGSLIDMIVKNGYIGLFSNKMVEHMKNPNRVHKPPISLIPVKPEIDTQISLCYPKNAVLSEGAAAFVAYFKSQHPLLQNS